MPVKRQIILVIPTQKVQYRKVKLIKFIILIIFTVVTACVKQPFRLITSYSASYDGGVAVDGEYRLRVKSAKYDSEVSYSKGHFISFRCESFFDYRKHLLIGLIVIYCG